jgi:hypothetical protein
MMRTARIASVTCLVLCLAASRVAAQTGPAVAGQWASVTPLPFPSSALHLLPTGKVLLYGMYASGGSDVRLWDPDMAISSLVPLPGYNVFCSGHTFLPDGRLFFVGGHIVSGVGLPNSSTYDAVSNVWAPGPNMNAGRWYPTATTLANGDVLTVSGTVDNTVGVNTLPQVFQAASGTWRDLTGAQLKQDLYLRMHLAPNGQVFTTAPSQFTRYLDTSGTGAWTMGATRTSGYRDYGSSVMYDDGKVLVMGGGDPPTKLAEVINLNLPTPAWRLVAPMANARRQLNATLLPDGKVLVTGGTSGPGFNNATTPVYAAEMWDPATEQWTTMASAQAKRLYHSAALLLPDGRVLTTGGDGITQVELYSPPYLFAGARPTITSAPAAVSRAQSFFVATPDAASIAKVRWIRLPSVTHAFDMNQRINTLSFSQAAGGLTVVPPSDPNLAPPGHYMLFILYGNGVPSVARIVGLDSGTPPPAPPLAPTGVAASNGTSATSVTVSWSASANATSYTVYRSTAAGTLGATVGTSTTTSLTDSPVTQGVVYYYSVVATGVGGTSAPSTQVSGYAAAAGSSALAGVGVASSATVNLTTLGTSDWAKWPGYIHKAVGGAQISNYAMVGAVNAVTYSSDPRTVTWSDGTPTASGSDKAGVYAIGIGNGFQITAPAGTASRTLYVYVGGWSSGGRLVAHLSDNSVPDYVNASYSGAGLYDAVYTLTYRTALEGRQLVVKWTQASGAGIVTLQGAALK